MVNHYHANVVFEDPAFGELKGDQARQMWHMLIERGGDDLQVSHSNIQVDADAVTAQWTAKYRYGTNKRPVVNHVQARFRFRDGKIISHTDHFSMWKWSRQALGASGLLLGWTGFLKRKVQTRTRSMLDKYMRH